MINKTLRTFAMALLALLAFNANATTNNITAPLTFNSSDDAAFSRTFHLGEFGSFTDSYTFSIQSGTEADLSANVGSKYSLSFANIVLFGVDLTNVSLTGLVNVNGVQTTTSFGLFNLGKNNTFSLEASNLTAGDYSLNISGISALTSGVFKSKYSGDVSLAVTAVPEPETYSMMLAGLGLMGFAARRKLKA